MRSSGGSFDVLHWSKSRLRIDTGELGPKTAVVHHAAEQRHYRVLAGI
jgi:hypothetical protein